MIPTTNTAYISDLSKSSVSSEPHFFSISDYNKNTEILESILTLPNSIFIEKELHDSYLNKNFSTCDLLLSLTTTSCYNSNVAHLFTDYVNKRFELRGKKNDEMATCLHEAIMNAMLHGNLKMASDFRTLKGLYKYQAEIEYRLTVDAYKLRCVTIGAWKKGSQIKLAVSDEGNGFNINKYRGNNDTLPHGRGLALIHSLADKVWLENDRRTLFMQFDC